MRQLLLLALTGALILGGCQQQAPQATETTASQPAPVIELTPGLITAGQGIPEVQVDQPRAEVEKALGAPNEVDSNEFVAGQTYALYHTKGIEITYQDDKVQAITLHSKEDKWNAYTGALSEGVGVGSKAQEIVQVLGEPAEKTPQALRYPSKGLWFRLHHKRGEGDAQSWAETLSIHAPE